MAYTRLIWRSTRLPRYTPGVLRFPFGALRYVDAPSLRSQYQEIFLEREYDFSSTEPAPLILDCGANIGLSAIRFKQQHPRSHVVAFEADPAIAAVLQDNLTRLGFADVVIVRAAVWDRSGTVSFAADRADGGRMTEQPTGQQVRATRLADYINRPVALLKIDIEGAEYDVLRDLYGSEKIAHVQRIVCEFHGSADVAKQMGEVLSLLHRSGFRYTFTYARAAPDLPGTPEPTPFVPLRDGKYLLRMYAWQLEETVSQ
jgi:FkbM family methyltransferase